MALSPAEKQRRYRERLKAGARPVHYRCPRDRRSRLQRWKDAVEILIALQEHYRTWLEALPESLHDTTVHAMLETISDLDLEELRDVELPRGYGRD